MECFLGLGCMVVALLIKPGPNFKWVVEPAWVCRAETHRFQGANWFRRSIFVFVRFNVFVEERHAALNSPSLPSLRQKRSHSRQPQRGCGSKPKVGAHAPT